MFAKSGFCFNLKNEEKETVDYVWLRLLNRRNQQIKLHLTSWQCPLINYLEEEYPNEEESDNHDYGARDYEQVPEVPNYNNEQERNKDYDYENSPEYAEYDEQPNSGQESHFSR